MSSGERSANTDPLLDAALQVKREKAGAAAALAYDDVVRHEQAEWPRKKGIE